MKKKQIFTIIMFGLLILSIALMLLSKLEAILLVVALGLLLVFLLMLTYVSIVSYKNTNKEMKHREFEELMQSQNEQDSPFDEVEIQTQKRKRTRNDKISYVIICIVATIICAFMFVHLI